MSDSEVRRQLDTGAVSVRTELSRYNMKATVEIYQNGGNVTGFTVTVPSYRGRITGIKRLFDIARTELAAVFGKTTDLTYDIDVPDYEHIRFTVRKKTEGEY